MYKLSCHSSLALVNKGGKASEACMDGACADGACADKACAGGACIGKACVDGAYTDKACINRACRGGACVDRAYNIIYIKSPSVPSGNGKFVYIKGPIRLEILLNLNKAKNLLVLI